MNLLRVFSAVLALVVLSACHVQIKVPQGGKVIAQASDYACEAGETCFLSVTNTRFNQTFEAVPDAGYTFTGWQVMERGFCGGSTEPCQLSTRGFNDIPLAMAMLAADDEFFFLDPVFETLQEGRFFQERFCEMLMITQDGVGPLGRLYGTQDVGICAQEHWDELDAEAIATEFEVDRVVLSGPRFWVLDDMSQPVGATSDYLTPGLSETLFFGSLGMRKLAVGRLSEAMFDGKQAYEPGIVYRDSVWHYLPGRRVYQLQDPEGRKYLMQSFSQAVDPDLQLEDLADLGARLDLPEGWSFRSYVFNFAFEVSTVDGEAEVIFDELLNTYQLIP